MAQGHQPTQAGPRDRCMRWIPQRETVTRRLVDEKILRSPADESTTTSQVEDTNKRSLTGGRLAGLLLLCACLFSFARQLYESRGYYFVGDDWPLLFRGLSWGGYLQPYNEHLSIIAVGTYRIFGAVFGMNHTLPIQMFAALCYLSISVGLYLVAKTRIGPAPALLAACAVLFYPQFDVVVSAFNHYLALIGVVALAGLLPKAGRRYDWMIFGVLCFALASSGVAVAGSAGCLVFLVLVRPNWRRWLAVLVPCALWLAWYLRYSPGAHASKTYPFGDLLRYLSRCMMSSFRGLAFDSHIGGVLLAIAFVILFALRCRHGLHAVVFTLSWMAANIVWWVGISQTRMLSFHPENVFRYRLVGSVFLILASLPTYPIARHTSPRWQEMASGLRSGRSKSTFAGIAVVCLLFAFINPVVGANNSNNFGKRLHSWLLVEEAAANIGPHVVPNEATISSPMLSFPVWQYRRVVKAYGRPTGSTPGDFDRFALGRQAIALQARPKKARISCIDQVGVIRVPTSRVLLMQAGARAVDVRVRYLGRDWIPVGRIQPGQRSSLAFPWMIVDRDWQVDAPGACYVILKVR